MQKTDPHLCYISVFSVFLVFSRLLFLCVFWSVFSWFRVLVWTCTFTIISQLFFWVLASEPASAKFWVKPPVTFALPAKSLRLKAHMQQNAYNRNLKWTCEDFLPCNFFAIKPNRSACKFGNLLLQANERVSGHEWTASSSLHDTRTVNLVLVQFECHTGK